MDDRAQQSSAEDQAQSFIRDVMGCDRVLVEKRNALGEMNVSVVPGVIARIALGLTKEPQT